MNLVEVSFFMLTAFVNCFARNMCMLHLTKFWMCIHTCTCVKINGRLYIFFCRLFAFEMRQLIIDTFVVMHFFSNIKRPVPAVWFDQMSQSQKKGSTSNRDIRSFFCPTTSSSEPAVITQRPRESQNVSEDDPIETSSSTSSTCYDSVDDDNISNPE